MTACAAAGAVNVGVGCVRANPSYAFCVHPPPFAPSTNVYWDSVRRLRLVG